MWHFSCAIENKSDRERESYLAEGRIENKTKGYRVSFGQDAGIRRVFVQLRMSGLMTATATNDLLSISLRASYTWWLLRHVNYFPTPTPDGPYISK